MVKAWYIDSSQEDPRLEHHLDPPQFVDIDKLIQETGIQYWNVDADQYDNDESLSKVKKLLRIGRTDFLTMSRDVMPDFDERVKTLYTEHLHSEEEARLVIEGSTYFDVRDKEDRWIRVHTVKGDLLVLPSGLYHRFTLDTGNYVKVLRLFVGDSVWSAHNRPADNLQARLEYLHRLGQTA